MSAPISWGERGHTRWDFVPVLEQKLADYIMPDVTWTGGISELKKISTLCEAYYIPVSPHDAAGISVVRVARRGRSSPCFEQGEPARLVTTPGIFVILICSGAIDPLKRGCAHPILPRESPGNG